MDDVVHLLGSRSFLQLGRAAAQEKYRSDVSGLEIAEVPQSVFLIALLVAFFLVVWAVYALVRYSAVLPAWVILLGVVLLFFPAGPVLTLLLVYVALASVSHK